MKYALKSNSFFFFQIMFYQSFIGFILPICVGPSTLCATFNRTLFTNMDASIPKTNITDIITTNANSNHSISEEK